VREVRWLLGLALFLGLALRLGGLGRESLWLDEGFARTLARRPLPELLSSARTGDRNPPLHGVVLHVWIRAFGDSEASLRLPSALCGILSVAALYGVGRRLAGERSAALAALLLAVSPLHVAFAQEARPSSLTALLVLLSMRSFLEVIEGAGWRARVGYGLASTLLLYSHTYGAFFVLAQGLYVGLARRNALGRWLGVASAVGLLFLPWLWIEFEQLRLVRQGFWLVAPTLRTLGASLQAFAGSQGLLALLGLFALAGLLQAPAARGLLLLWLLVPVLVPFGLSHILTPMYHTRYVLGASLPLYLLAGQGLAALPWTALRLAAAAGLLGLALAAIGHEREAPRKEQWREAAALLDAEARPGDLVLFDAGFCLRHVYSYYARRRDYQRHPVEAGSVAGLERLAQGRAQVWVVYSHRRDHEGRILRDLERQGLREAGRRNLTGIELIRLARAP
jgi:mannosyltransferase